MARNVQFRRPIRSQSRKTSWQFGPSTGSVGVPAPQGVISTTATVLGGVGQEFLIDGITLVRTRGTLMAYLLTAGAASEGFACSFGIGIANVDAFTAGIVSLMTPFTNMDWDGWLYHVNFGLYSLDGSPTTEIGVSVGFREQVDSKAMRKVGINEVVYCALETVEAGTCTMNWFYQGRQLLKLA